jgi:hypothetical protein
MKGVAECLIHRAMIPVGRYLLTIKKKKREKQIEREVCIMSEMIGVIADVATQHGRYHSNENYMMTSTGSQDDVVA